MACSWRTPKLNKRTMAITLIIVAVVIVSIVGTLALNASLAKAQKGSVTFQSDVAGVTVALVGPSETVISGVIGQNRQFTFLDIPVGTYQGIATKDGYEPSHIVGVTINPSGNPVIPLSLNPKSPMEQVYVSTNPQAVIIRQGSNGTITVTATSPYDFEGEVTFSCSLPSGVTESYSPGSVTLTSGGTASTTLTLTVSSVVVKGIYAIPMELTYGQHQGIGLGFLLQVV